MSKLNARLNELTNRLHSAKPSTAIQENLENAHALLTRAARNRNRSGRLREVTEEGLRALAKSLELESWSDEPSNGLKILSITGKIIVVDVAFDFETSEFRNCTLVLASQDGLQDEIVVDGQDIMTRQLASNDLGGFSRSLERLAFLDKHSDPSIDLNLFNVQDALREAVNRRIAAKTGLACSPVSSTSHLDLSFAYYRPKVVSDSKHHPTSKKDSHARCTAFLARLEIELQPVSAQVLRKQENNTMSDEVATLPVLHYPRSWIDGSNSWLPNKQFLASKSQADLRYAVSFEPAIVMPRKLLLETVALSSSRVDFEPHNAQNTLERLVYTPAGPRLVESTIEVKEQLCSVNKIAFSHVKELEIILGHARQHAICQLLLSSLGDLPGLSASQMKLSETLLLRCKVVQEYVQDEISAIDDRKAIRLSINTSQPSAHAELLTIQIQPDFDVKCSHTIDKDFFSQALRLTEDVAIATLATASRSKKSTPESPPSKTKTESDRMDFRRDPQDAATKNLTATEAKQGFTYSVPVESHVELKTTSSIDSNSPIYLAQLGRSLRKATIEP